MAGQGTTAAAAAPQLDALNGMRFFAVFHIFIYHLWSVRFEIPGPKSGPMRNAYANMDDFAPWLNGELSTTRGRRGATSCGTARACRSIYWCCTTWRWAAASPHGCSRAGHGPRCARVE